MKTLERPQDVRHWCDTRRAEGKRIAFVPTMGALHAGHLSLVRIASERADEVVVSIFVNPTQFGPAEDFASYPRNLAEDVAKCADAGVRLVFTPAAEDMYPPGNQTSVEVAELSRGLCGAQRPGHFRGVCTVVTKLLNIVGPSDIVLGQKDYQQLQVLRQMVRDLNLPHQVIAGPTVRESDGLALSSRNARLSTQQRESASSLYRGLRAVQERASGGGLTATAATTLARSIIEREPETVIEYIEVCHPETLASLERVEPGKALVVLAVRVGATRLIDNILI